MTIENGECYICGQSDHITSLKTPMFEPMLVLSLSEKKGNEFGMCNNCIGIVNETQITNITPYIINAGGNTKIIIEGKYIYQTALNPIVMFSYNQQTITVDGQFDNGNIITISPNVKEWLNDMDFIEIDVAIALDGKYFTDHYKIYAVGLFVSH